MHIVLTHEQADFDAIASLLAVSLLDPAAVPVLPRRVNRNVRAFLTLYRDRLPMVEFRDLQRDPIERVTLVDTQTMASVKGLQPDTHVHVVDHHPPGENLDPGWTKHIEIIGATTTLFAEDIEAMGMDPDVISATLLLLGIYEDTGSLTYANTTPRDARACAWLLERGANLSVVADFLNHPLSQEQRQLYDALFESAETIHFHGLHVVIAMAHAPGFMDEISTLAHKLRDLFDPAGLFVLVALDGHTQMVARSTTASLDVAEVAAHFGGGGHARAAAALIRNGDLTQLRAELIELLTQVVRPEITVGEIMSRGPQLLSPSATVASAAEQMQRFGHEGYPVVDQGQVIGLLTRRAVDRAMAHGMDQMPISRVMNAGRLTVTPDDSVQHLQQVMIEQDWGQVPVVDQVSGEVLGIVTRTDLLNTLAKPELAAGDSTMADQLERALPAPRLGLLRLIADQAGELNIALYIVGGFVRDLLLGEPSIDFDLVVEGDAISLGRALAERYGGRISSHRRFGTAKWQLDLDEGDLQQALGGAALQPGILPQSLDLVSARTEFYTHPTALPSVQRGSIKLDLHRRDFSINTLALRLDGPHYGELLDHWGGGRDLQEKRIRILHSLSFVDDPTRILRAVRLEQRLQFSIEPRTLQLLHDAKPLLDRVSGERIRSELELIFREPKVLVIMDRLQSLSLLHAIHPQLNWNERVAAGVRALATFTTPKAWGLEEPPSTLFLQYGLWLAPLPAPALGDLCNRLNFPAGMRTSLLQANRLIHDLPFLCPHAKPSHLAGRMRDLKEEALVVAWLALDDEPECRSAVDRFLREWRFVLPRTTGDTLRELGLPPGPVYSRIINTLRDAWLDGLVTTAQEEEMLMREIMDDDNKLS